MSGTVPVETFYFADRLNAAMGYRGMSQTGLARALGLSKNTVSKMTRGVTINPSFMVMRVIAIELNVSMDYLAGLSDTMERKP